MSGLLTSSLTGPVAPFPEVATSEVGDLVPIGCKQLAVAGQIVGPMSGEPASPLGPECSSQFTEHPYSYSRVGAEYVLRPECDEPR